VVLLAIYKGIFESAFRYTENLDSDSRGKSNTTVT